MKIITNLLLIILIIYPFIILISALNISNFSADYLVILGNALNNNKISKVLYFRLNKALKVLKNKPNLLIVTSGGITSNNIYSEAEVMKQYLIENGIDSNKIIIEDKSKNTIENILFIKNIVKDNKTIILSSNYHILRIKLITKLLKLNNVKYISCFTPIKDLIKHLIIEEVFIFIHAYRIIKNKY